MFIAARRNWETLACEQALGVQGVGERKEPPPPLELARKLGNICFGNNVSQFEFSHAVGTRSSICRCKVRELVSTLALRDTLNSFYKEYRHFIGEGFHRHVLTFKITETITRWL